MCIRDSVIENRHEGAEFAKGTTSMTVSGEQKDNLATLALLVRGATPYLGSVVCKTPVYDSFTLPEIKWFGTVSKYQPSGTLAWDEGQTVTIKEKPESPTTPEEPSTPTKTSDSPKTGDNTPFVALFAMMGISAAGLIFAGYKRFRRVKKSK